MGLLNSLGVFRQGEIFTPRASWSRFSISFHDRFISSHPLPCPAVRCRAAAAGGGGGGGGGGDADPGGQFEQFLHHILMNESSHAGAPPAADHAILALRRHVAVPP